MSSRTNARPRTRWAAFLAVAVAVAYTALDLPPPTLGGDGEDGAAVVETLFDARRSGEMVEVAGVVERQLPDDLKGSRHQRFIVGLSSGRTVLVSHNIDLAPRIDALRDGDAVRLRGQYEWNDRGGVIHWTHHDPGGRRAGGWIEHAGRTYR